MTDLRTLYAENEGKVSDKWSSYLSVYETLFGPRRNAPIRLLEIGVQNGGSLEILARYFPAAEAIVGCDVDPRCAALRYDDPRISIIVGDCALPATVDKISQISDTYDIIIDDGSHRSDDVVRAFALYFPRLVAGGLYIAEDLHCAYWAAYEGGLEAPHSSISFFKRLADIVNHEHWGATMEPEDALSFFARTWGTTFDGASLQSIEQISFRNSLVIVTKGEAIANDLGSRVVSGAVASVEPASLALRGVEMCCDRSDESQNRFGPLTPRAEESVAGREAAAIAVRELAAATAEPTRLRPEAEALVGQVQSARAETQRVEAEKAALAARRDELKAQEQRLRRENAELAERAEKADDEKRRVEAEAKAAALEIADRTSRIEADCRKKVQESEALANEMRRRSEDQTRLLANLRRADYDGRLPAKLTGLKRWMPGRRRKFRRLARDYRSVAASALFDASWYLANNPDVAGAGRDPTLHFIQYGAREGRDPGPLFSTYGYLAANPDVAAANANALLHFIRYGAKEGRSFAARAVSGRAASNDAMEAIARDLFAEQQAELSAETAARLLESFTHKPLISVIMPVYKTPVDWLRRAIASLQEQYYDRWELCAIDDCSPTNEQRSLLQALAASDARIRFKALDKNGGISAASNAALAMSRGEYVALLDHDDEITPDALLRVVEAINAQPDADFLYSDECKIDDTSARRLFHFILKPDWSPEIMFNYMLTGHFSVYQKSVVDSVGGFRGKYDFSQDYDLALRIAEVAKRIVHVERILYLWRAIPGSAATGAKNFARETNIAALADSLKRRGIPGVVLALPVCNYVHIPVSPEDAKVSLVIPSDSLQNLLPALHAIRQQTDYPNYEVVVVCNGSLAERLSVDYVDWPALRLVKYNKVYNFSDKCNEGARAASGDIVVFYNDDVFPLQADWIQKLIEYLWVPGVGGVSPKLLYPDDTIQYAGMISGAPGLCGTAYHRVARDADDNFLSMHKAVRNVSILSGACCALRKDVFWAVGGFDAVNTPDGHSDLDLSYKLREAGYRSVYTPHAVLRHVGNHSWGAKQDKYKADIFCLKRWGPQVSVDPYFTASMKRVLCGEFRFEYRIHAEEVDPRIEYFGPDVLFVSHELTLTGAPRMLFYAAQVVKDNGGFPVIMAPMDGPLREEMERAGLVVIIDESIRYNHFLFERFARNFDLAIVNTIAIFGIAKQLAAIPVLRTIWWLHEGQMMLDYSRQLQEVDCERVHAVCNSEYSKTFLPPQIAAEVLRYGIPDEAAGVERRSPGVAMTFLVAGTIEPRKGQDLFVDAIAALPPEVRKQCRFLMNGNLSEVHQIFWKNLLARMTKHPEVAYLGSLSHVEQLRAMADSDVLVCCSRDEPFSLVAMEAAMLSKPSILSDHVGAGEVLGEGSSLKFPSGDVAALSKQLRYAFEHREELTQMGVEARKQFELELSIDSFERRFTKLLR